MKESERRLAAAAQETGVDLADTVLDRLASLLERVEAQLKWPTWESQRLSTLSDAEPATVPAADPAPVTDLTLQQTIETALARARLASEGGAYTFIVDPDTALASAGRPEYDGPLNGLTLAVKDLIAVAGRPLRAGSAVREDAPPEPVDAPVVATLRRAGAVFTGTTTLHEFAFGVTGINDHTGTPLNPHDPTRVPGGSSSGSAVAVAEGSAGIAIGTDTGGSVRIPAALCGVVGFKPAYGAYPIEGVFPLSPTLDHVGFLARSVADVQRVHVLFAPPAEGEIRPRRIGLLRADLAQSEPVVQQRVEAVAQRLVAAGCKLEEIDWPDAEIVFAISTAIMFSEAATIHRAEMDGNAARYGADVRARLLQGLALPAVDYVTALRGRRQLQDQVRARLAEVDCVIGPTVGMVAPTLEEARDPAIAGRLVAFTRLANVAGIPALSLPLPGARLPVSLQIMARDERLALGAGLFIERLVESQ
ncbi:MAG TPA: amidase [Anaerolineae bacterium]